MILRFRWYRWANEHLRHGMPSVDDLEARGWVRIANHPRWRDSWLMGKKAP